MKGLSFIFFLFFCFSYKNCIAQFGTNKPTHIIILNNGASFKASIIYVNDSITAYNSNGLFCEIRNSEILAIESLFYIKKSGVFYGKYDSINTANLANISYKKPIFTNNKNYIFLNFGAKFGSGVDDGITYTLSSFLLDFGYMIPYKKRLYWGPSIGIHPFYFYDAVLFPMRLEGKYVFQPQQQKSLLVNAALGYGLAVSSGNPITQGGVTFKVGLSRLKNKTDGRMNEFGFGFSFDQFQTQQSVFNQFTRTMDVEKRYVKTGRIYFSKSWWFKS